MTRYEYRKPDLPQGWFMLVHENGYDEGPFNDTMLIETDLPGEPWVLQSVGSPTVLRVLEQKGDTLTLERKTGKGDWTTYKVQVMKVEKQGKGWKYAEA